MSRSNGPLRPLLAVGLTAALAATTLAASPQPPAGHAGAGLLATAAKPSATGAKQRGSALPDSVLARVGSDRQITLADFRHAWTQVKPPARPDSLTPQSAREFLDLMIGKEALGATALRETWVWTADESLRYEGLRDRLTMAMVLDSALEATQAVRVAEGKDSLDAAELGTLARDEAVRAMDIVYRDDVLQRLAQAWAAIPPPPRDSGVFAAIRALGRDPQIGEVDLHRIIAVVEGVDFPVSRLVTYWKRLNPLSRPRIEAPAQVRELMWNALYEDLLRRRAAKQGYAQAPAVAAQLAKERELIAVTHLVGREVYGKIPLDSLTLARFYLENERAWDLPPRVRLLRLVLPDRPQADAVIEKLRDAAQVESLTAQAERAGLSYHAEYSADTDSLIYTRGMSLGVGGVMGPDSTSQGWAVSRVVAVLPGRPRPYAEVRELVRNAVYGNEGERLMRALLDRVRSSTEVAVNEPALKRAVEPAAGR